MTAKVLITGGRLLSLPVIQALIKEGIECSHGRDDAEFHSYFHHYKESNKNKSKRRTYNLKEVKK